MYSVCYLVNQSPVADAVVNLLDSITCQKYRTQSGRFLFIARDGLTSVPRVPKVFCTTLASVASLRQIGLKPSKFISIRLVFMAPKQGHKTLDGINRRD